MVPACLTSFCAYHPLRCSLTLLAQPCDLPWCEYMLFIGFCTLGAPHEKRKNVRTLGRSFKLGASSRSWWPLLPVLTLCGIKHALAPFNIQQQSMCYQMMSCSRYLTYIDEITILTIICLPLYYGNGTYWCMCAEGGNILCLHLHSVSISKFSAHTAVLSAVLALAWPGSQGFGLAFLGFGFTKP